MADFTDPSVSFKAGFDSAQTVADAYRRTKAQNALAAAYGPAVTSFQDAQDQQTLGFNAKANPIKLQQAQEDLSHSQALDPLTVQAQQNTNDLNSQLAPMAVQQQQNATDTSSMTLQTAKAAQLHGVLSASLDNLGTQLANVTDPNQRGAMFDAEIQHLAPLIGADPRMIASQLRDERTRVVNGGAEAIPQIQNDLDGLIMGSLSPGDKQKLLNAQAQGGLISANTTKANAQAAAATSNAAANTVKAQTAAAKAAGTGAASPEKLAALKLYGQTMAPQTLTAIQTALDNLPKVSGLAAMRKLNEHIPGTPEYNLAQAVDQIKKASSITDFRDLKALGVSMSRTNQSEFNAAADSMGNLDLGQDLGTVRANLQKLQGTFQDVRDSYQQQIDAAQAPAAAAGAPAGAAGKVVDYSTYFGGQ